MPLHDWTDRGGWEGVHHLWLAELARWLKARLPAGYRAFIGSPPTIGIGSLSEKPDVSVREWRDEAKPTGPVAPDGTIVEPTVEVALATDELAPAVQVEYKGRLIAAIEIISPRNKDRPSAREKYLYRYVGYLLNGMHLMVIEVLRRPFGFSFADEIAREIELDQPGLPPFAAVYRVGEPAAEGGRYLAHWRGELQAEVVMPKMPLPLDVHTAVVVDLEATYMRAAEDAYLT